MSIMGLANSLMLDFRCFILPRFVYATENAFSDNTLVETEIIQRVKEFSESMIHFTKAIQSIPEKN